MQHEILPTEDRKDQHKHERQTRIGQHHKTLKRVDEYNFEQANGE